MIRGLSTEVQIRTIIIIIVCTGVFLIVPCCYYLYMIPEKAMGFQADFNAYGFSCNGSCELVGTFKRGIGFEGSQMTVSVIYGGQFIESVIVAKASKQGSNVLDTVVFEASSKSNIFDIHATNLSHCDYTFQTEGRAFFEIDYGKTTSSPYGAVFDPTRPEVAILLDSEQPRATLLSVSDGTFQILLGFQDGSLRLTGPSEFDLDFKGYRVGIAINISISGFGRCGIQVNGGSKVYIFGLEQIRYSFPFRMHDNIVHLIHPSGNLNINTFSNQKMIEMIGGEDLIFHDISVGVLDVFPQVTKGLFEARMAGEMSSVTIKSLSGGTDLTAKSVFDLIFFPFVTLAVIVFIVNPQPLRGVWRGLVPTVIIVIGSAFWAVYSEQPQWLQMILGLAPLYVTMIERLFHERFEVKPYLHAWIRPASHYKSQLGWKPGVGIYVEKIGKGLVLHVVIVCEVSGRKYQIEEDRLSPGRYSFPRVQHPELEIREDDRVINVSFEYYDLAGTYYRQPTQRLEIKETDFSPP